MHLNLARRVAMENLTHTHTHTSGGPLPACVISEHSSMQKTWQCCSNMKEAGGIRNRKQREQPLFQVVASLSERNTPITLTVPRRGGKTREI